MAKQGPLPTDNGGGLEPFTDIVCYGGAWTLPTVTCPEGMAKSPHMHDNSTFSTYLMTIPTLSNAVGHFGRGGASALQAALAVELREQLHVQGRLLLFDPVLSQEERTAANSLGFTMIEENEVAIFLQRQSD